MQFFRISLYKCRAAPTALVAALLLQGCSTFAIDESPASVKTVADDASAPVESKLRSAYNQSQHAFAGDEILLTLDSGQKIATRFHSRYLSASGKRCVQLRSLHGYAHYHLCNNEEEGIGLVTAR